jgi:hypothetical protein
MDTIQEVYSQLCTNSYPGKVSIDIYEHLPTLYKYTRECDTVFETGVRGCVSSWAFLYGLLDGNTHTPKKLFMNDIEPCNIGPLLEASRPFSNVDVKYEWKSNLLLDFTETYDLTFIDTWHVYGQLKRELNKFSKITNKYIIMHDTTVDEVYGESLRCGMDTAQQSIQYGIPVDEITKGLWPAVVEFVQNNPEWYIKERFTNNNGLTILARRNEGEQVVTDTYHHSFATVNLTRNV